MSWTREQLKSNARAMVKKNWLVCAAASFILGLVSGNEGFEFNFNFQEDVTNNAMGMAGNQLAGDWLSWILRWLPAVLTVGIFAFLIGIAVSFLLGNVLEVGGCRLFIHNIYSKGELNDLLFGFQNQYGNVVKVMAIRQVIIWLFTLLLVIPGIYMSYCYRLVPYLLADNPELEYSEALSTSKELMDGEKFNTFILDLSFILWNIGSAFTFGLLELFWVGPYRRATNAELYLVLKERQNRYE